MLKIFKYVTVKEWLAALVCMVFIVIQVGLELKMPDYMAEITQRVQSLAGGAAGIPGSDMAYVLTNGGFMLLCAFGSLLGAVVVGFFASRIGASFSRRIRSLLFGKVNSLSMEEISRFSTSSLITRSTNDITQVQMLIVMGINIIFRAPIMAAWAIYKTIGADVRWAFVTGGAVVIMSVLVTFVMIFVMPKFKKMQALTDNITRVTRENLLGLRVVRAYNAEGYQEDKFDAANSELTGTVLFTSRSMSVMMPVMTIIMSGLSLAIYWIGAHLINGAGALDRLDIFADMVVYSQYAVQVIMAFIMLVMMFVMMPRASVSAKRINEVLDTQASVKGGTVLNGKPGREGEVVFNNVSFKYPDAAEYVLKDISFKAKRGETVAFIGSIGSGKSTLVNLAARFFDATEGEILIGGVNVKEYDLDALYKKIGYVPQKAVLFKGTAGDNIAFGDNAESGDAEAAVKKAAEIAQAAEFIESMEGGYGAAVSQGGANLSGGQKQRVAIARAVCRGPEIYIFDDSFSALDYKTDRTLRAMLKKETAGVTSLIVAQRIGTIMDADKIVVLNEGQVAGIGTHKELLKNCGVYKEIAMSQLSEEELA